MDHDRLFKQLLTTFFAEFVELFLPEVNQYLDKYSIEFLDKEMFTDLTGGERHDVDLVARARFQGRDTFFLIHVESQASRESDFGNRMFRYFARLHEKFNLPVYPVALFSYDAPLTPEPELYEVTFPNRQVLSFHYHVIQLNRLNWRDFVRQPNPVVAALMTKMNIAPEDRPKVKLECLRMIATLKLNPARSALIGEFMLRYLRLSQRDSAVYNREVESLKPPPCTRRGEWVRCACSSIASGQSPGNSAVRWKSYLWTHWMIWLRPFWTLRISPRQRPGFRNTGSVRKTLLDATISGTFPPTRPWRSRVPSSP